MLDIRPKMISSTDNRNFKVQGEKKPNCTVSFKTLWCFRQPWELEPSNTVKQEINLHLTKCAVLLACDLPYEALKMADEALDIARYHRKTELYRGLCYKHEAAQEWKLAQDCFASVVDVREGLNKEWVELLSLECEQMISGMGSVMDHDDW
jgi:hypothetical protein